MAKPGKKPTKQPEPTVEDFLGNAGLPIVYPCEFSRLHLKHGTPEGLVEEFTLSDANGNATTQTRTVYPPLDEAFVTAALQWETEDEYLTRIEEQLRGMGLLGEEKEFNAEAAPDIDGSGTVKDYHYGDDYLLKDMEGQKVRCGALKGNREFKVPGMKRYRTDMLNRRWADSRNTKPEDIFPRTINGESCIIGRHGNVLSAQKRFVALKLACQIWRSKDHDHWLTLWPEQPTIEALVFYGADESHFTVSTLDNVEPRTMTDTVYTSELFRELPGPAHKECSKMLASAVSFLWDRTGAGDSKSQSHAAFDGEKTNSALMGFQGRHRTLDRYILKMHEIDKTRGISNGYRIKTGDCSALMYLMASGKTDGHLYRAMESPQELADESGPGIDFGLEKQAFQFWHDLANDKIMVVDAEFEKLLKGGPIPAPLKYAIFVKAWKAYTTAKNGKVIAADVDMTESYAVDDKTGNRTLSVTSQLDGIDLGDRGEPIGSGSSGDEKPEDTRTEEQKELDAKIAEEAASKIEVARQSELVAEASRRKREEAELARKEAAKNKPKTPNAPNGRLNGPPKAEEPKLDQKDVFGNGTPLKPNKKGGKPIVIKW